MFLKRCCPVLGEIPQPTFKYLLKKQDVVWIILDAEEKYCDANRNVITSLIVEVICCKLLEVWKKLRVPLLSEISLKNKVIKFITRYRELRNKVKSYTCRGFSAGNKIVLEVERFCEECCDIFTLSACCCGCSLELCQCSCGTSSELCVILNNKEILQETTLMRLMKLNQVESIEIDENNSVVEHSQESDTNSPIDENDTPDNSEDEEDCNYEENPNSSDDEYEQSTVSKMNNLSLLTYSRECDRYNVSINAATALINAALTDLNLIDVNNRKLVVTSSKIVRSRHASRTDRLKNHGPFSPKSLYFDGKKSGTKIFVENDFFSKYSNVNKENVVILEQPGNKYVTFVSTESGKAEEATNKMLEKLEKLKVNLENLQVLGCDGCPTNTGHENGIIRRFELRLVKPLFHAVCLLHLGELPFRKLFEALLGIGKGPCDFGPLTKDLEECESKPLVKFVKIPSQDFPIFIEEENLSKDQKLLFEIGKSIVTGRMSDRLACSKIGPLYKARWLTAATKTLRLYASTPRPSPGLKEMAKYIVRVYIPFWFKVKSSPLISQGSDHFLYLIQSTRYLNANLRNLVQETLKTNSFYCFAENVILSLIASPDAEMRRFGFEKIKEAREKQSNKLRQLNVAKNKINFKASNIREMIRWEASEVTEPPLTFDLSSEEVSEYSSATDPPRIEFDFPNHTQATESLIPVIGMAAAKVKESERDGFVLNVLKSRDLNKSFDSKQNYSFEF